MSNQQYPVDTREVLSPQEFREQFFDARVREIRIAVDKVVSALDAQKAHDQRVYEEQLSRFTHMQDRADEANPVMQIPGFSGLVAGGDGASVEQHYPVETAGDSPGLLPGGPEADELRRYIGVIHGANDA